MYLITHIFFSTGTIVNPILAPVLVHCSALVQGVTTPQGIMESGTKIIPCRQIRGFHEMHSPTILNTKLKLSRNLFGPPLCIKPGSLRLAATPSEAD